MHGGKKRYFDIVDCALRCCAGRVSIFAARMLRSTTTATTTSRVYGVSPTRTVYYVVTSCSLFTTGGILSFDTFWNG
jgi:hypothetical protein